MRYRAIWLTILVPLLGTSLGWSQSAPADARDEIGQCEFYGSSDLDPLSGQDELRGEAIILGKEFTVPELAFRFVDKRTGEAVVPEYVDVLYLWKWLQYPASDYRWGVWTDASDGVRCTTGERSELTVPSHTVKPRGWYDGKHTRSYFGVIPWWTKKPHFDRLEIKFKFRGTPYLIIKRGELSRYRDATAVLTLPSAGYPDVEFEPRAE